MFQRPLTFITRTVDRFFKLQSMQRLEEVHPKVVRFLKNRLGMQDFLGLPLTLLFSTAIVNYAMLTEISENIVNSANMKMIDSSVGLFFFHHRADTTASAFYYFTQLGSTTGVAIMFLVAALVLVLKKKWHYLAALLLAVLGTGASIYFTKVYFHRERPLDVGYYKPSSFSFPSGHSAEALSLFGMIAVLVLLERQHIRNAYFWVSLCLTYILLIGFSRIFLGVHFVSDVVGGYLLGSLWLILAVCMLEYLLLHYKQANPLEQQT